MIVPTKNGDERADALMQHRMLLYLQSHLLSVARSLKKMLY